MIKKALFMGVAALCLFSCKSDRDEETQVTIVGKWQPYKSVAYSVKTGAVITDLTEVYTDCQKKGTLEFGGDEKFTSISYYENYGKCGIGDQTSGTYSYNAATKEITSSWGGDTFKGKVRDLSKADLALESPADEDLDGDGVDDVFVTMYKKL